MKNTTILHELSPDQITSFFNGLQNQLIELKQSFEPKKPLEYLTRDEVAQILKCDLSTVHNWTKQGKLIQYGIGNRRYYKRTEVENAIIPLK